MKHPQLGPIQNLTGKEYHLQYRPHPKANRPLCNTEWPRFVNALKSPWPGSGCDLLLHCIRFSQVVLLPGWADHIHMAGMHHLRNNYQYTISYNSGIISLLVSLGILCGYYFVLLVTPVSVPLLIFTMLIVPQGQIQLRSSGPW